MRYVDGDYRPVIPKEDMDILVECAEYALRKVDSRYFNAVGIFGSATWDRGTCGAPHDADFVVMLNPNRRLGKAFLETSRLYTELDNQLKKVSDGRLYCVDCPQKVQQADYSLIAAQEHGLDKVDLRGNSDLSARGIMDLAYRLGLEGQIEVHRMTYIDWRDLLKDAAKTSERYPDNLRKGMFYILGDESDLEVYSQTPDEVRRIAFWPEAYNLPSKARNFPLKSSLRSAWELAAYLNKHYGYKVQSLPRTRDGIIEMNEDLLSKLDDIVPQATA